MVTKRYREHNLPSSTNCHWVNFRAVNMSHTRISCTFCGVGCGIYLETPGNKINGTCLSKLPEHETGESLRESLQNE